MSYNTGSAFDRSTLSASGICWNLAIGSPATESGRVPVPPSYGFRMDDVTIFRLRVADRRRELDSLIALFDQFKEYVERFAEWIKGDARAG